MTASAVLLRRLPAGGAAIREAQAILRRQGGPAAERGVALLDRIAADLARDPGVLARFGMPLRARVCATPLAEIAADAAAVPDAAAPAPDAEPGPAPEPGPAAGGLWDASFEAFLDRQRAEIARHPGTRGHTFGGGPRRGRAGGPKEDS